MYCLANGNKRNFKKIFCIKLLRLLYEKQMDNEFV